MNFLNNLSIGKRLVAGFAIALALLAALTAYSVSVVRDVDSSLAVMHDKNSVKQRFAINFRGSVHDRAIALRDVVLFENPVGSARAEADIARLAVDYEKSAGSMDGIFASDDGISAEERGLLADIKAIEAKTMPIVAEVIAARRAGDNGTARALLLNRAAPAFAEWLARINKFIDLQEAKNGAIAKDVRAETDGFQTTLVQLNLAAMLIVAGLAFWSLRSLRPLKRLEQVMREIASGNHDVKVDGADRNNEVGRMAKTVVGFRDAAVAQTKATSEKAKDEAVLHMVVTSLGESLTGLNQGDLTRTIDVDYPGTYAPIKTHFNEALASLRDLIGAVGESAASIRTGSGEIAHASEDLARRTEGNAASLEQTSASLVQIDGRLKATAVAAASTVERADQAMNTVSGGRSIADEAVQAMGRVSDSAKGIDSVIEGLDKIAFQTRVLAMNAAVEAGRAGDAGRGFAVVADLVSALAMRAEEEAKRARDQLTVTQTDIVTAVEAVEKVDGALAKISGDVGQVHELLGTMAADNQAQSAAITQISAAIGTMDQSTQQNAAMVEETSAAARNLTSEVGALTEQAGRFKVDAGGSKTARKPDANRARPVGDPASYTSPVKPLPAAAIKALVRHDEDWNAF